MPYIYPKRLQPGCSYGKVQPLPSQWATGAAHGKTQPRPYGREPMRHRYRYAAALASLLAAGGLALAGAGMASATVNTNSVETVGNGAAGYSVTNGPAFRNAGVQIKTDSAALNIGQPSGTSNTGGLGTQLCDPNNGFGAQVGEISNGTSFDVEYAVGNLTGAAKDNCVGNPLLPNANHLHSTTLDNLAVGDVVDVFASFRNVHASVHHNGHWTACWRGKGRKRHRVWHCRWHGSYTSHKWEGRVKFQAQDETAGYEVYASPWLHTAADWNLTEAGFGVQQTTTGLSADTVKCLNGITPIPNNPPLNIPPYNGCTGGNPEYNGHTGPNGTGAHTALADFTGFVNGFGLALPPFSPPIGAYAIHEVATTGSGLFTNPAVVAPNNSIKFSGNTFTFTDYVGNVIG